MGKHVSASQHSASTECRLFVPHTLESIAITSHDFTWPNDRPDRFARQKAARSSQHQRARLSPLSPKQEALLLQATQAFGHRERAAGANGVTDLTQGRWVAMLSRERSHE